MPKQPKREYTYILLEFGVEVNGEKCGEKCPHRLYGTNYCDLLHEVCPDGMRDAECIEGEQIAEQLQRGQKGDKDANQRNA